ncbi:unnamed protein product, partial [Ectocarpus sp. 12 AP-2014]
PTVVRRLRHNGKRRRCRQLAPSAQLEEFLDLVLVVRVGGCCCQLRLLNGHGMLLVVAGTHRTKPVVHGSENPALIEVELLLPLRLAVLLQGFRDNSPYQLLGIFLPPLPLLLSQDKEHALHPLLRGRDCIID